MLSRGQVEKLKEERHSIDTLKDYTEQDRMHYTGQPVRESEVLAAIARLLLVMHTALTSEPGGQ